MWALRGSGPLGGADLSLGSIGNLEALGLKLGLSARSLCFSVPSPSLL